MKKFFSSTKWNFIYYLPQKFWGNTDSRTEMKDILRAISEVQSELNEKLNHLRKLEKEMKHYLFFFTTKEIDSAKDEQKENN